MFNGRAVASDQLLIGSSPTKVETGQADGIKPRTLEVLQVCHSSHLSSHLELLPQSYGLGERLLREGNQIHMCVRERLFAHKYCMSDEV